MCIEDACGGTPPPPQQYASSALRCFLSGCCWGRYGGSDFHCEVHPGGVHNGNHFFSRAYETKKVWGWAETDAEIKRKHIRVTAETQQKRCPNPIKSLKMGSRGGPGADPSPGHGKSAKSGLDFDGDLRSGGGIFEHFPKMQFVFDGLF